MAIPRRIPIDFGTVFPYGAYMVGEISPVRDYDRSTRENVVQATDPTLASCSGRWTSSTRTRRRPSPTGRCR